MRNTWTKIISLIWAAGLGSLSGIQAQNYPEVPAQIPFGGINVRLDNSARTIIGSDIKVLMINQKYWEDKMERALLYFPIIESVLIEEEVPMDFKYLAAQESSLVPDAVSSSKAVGFWQFKEPTARELGLRVDNLVDERKNISSSTRAAATYLKRSNQTFNNWVASLYSYYLGISGVRDKIPSNWENAYDVTLTGKSDRYVLRFFAYKIAFEAGLDRYRSKNAVTLIEAQVGKGRGLEEIANELKISTADLKNYNRWLNSNRIPTDKPYYLTIPVASAKAGNVRESLAIVQSDNTLANKYELNDIGFPVLKKAANQPKGNNPHTRYEINGLPGILSRPGDYPNSLAKAGNLSPSKFRKFNDMDVSMPVIPGEVYYLARKHRKASVPFHSVRPGETLQSIAHMYGIRMKDLMKYNRITRQTYALETGRQMWLNKKRPASIPVKIMDGYETPGIQDSAPQPVAPSLITDYVPRPAETAAPVETAPHRTETVGSSEIPKNASERRRYTPKLADKTSAPASSSLEDRTVDKPSTPAVRPAAEPSDPAPRNVEAASKDFEVIPKENTSRSANNRIVIVKEGDKNAAAKGIPNEDARPVYSPAPSGGTAVKNDAAVTRSNEPAARTTGTSRSAAVPATESSSVSTAPERNVRSSTGAAQYHTVVRGETFFSVSKKYGLSLQELLQLNNMTTSDNLPVGKRLVVARGTGAASNAGSQPAKPETKWHTVVKGQTLFSIARMYNTSLQSLVELNSLNDTGVKIGQKLQVPAN